MLLEDSIHELDLEEAGLIGNRGSAASNGEARRKQIKHMEEVRLHIIRNARIENVGKSQSCMVSWQIIAGLVEQARVKQDELEEARLVLRQRASEAAEAAGRESDDEEAAALPGVRVPLKQLAEVLMTDVGGVIQKDGRVILLVDPGKQAQTFLRYRDCNYLNYCSSRDVRPASLRIGLLGAIRYGKAFVLDLGDVPVELEMDVGRLFDSVHPELWATIMSEGVGAYIRQHKYESLLTDEEKLDIQNEYHPVNFQGDRAAKCMVILLTSQFGASLPARWFDMMYPIHMVQPADAY